MISQKKLYEFPNFVERFLQKKEEMVMHLPN
jgi:hypothetical protein